MNDIEKEPVSNTEGKIRSVLKEVAANFITFLIIFATIFILSRTVFLTALVPTESMVPTIQNPAFTFGNRLVYYGNSPQRGDIVIFRRNNGDTKYYCKRVIGMPGDRINIYNGVVYINGEQLEEDYLNETPNIETLNFDVPEGCYFMMGDNRNHSGDSRYWDEHFVPEDLIYAKVVFSIPLSASQEN